MTPIRWGVEAEGRLEVIVPEGVQVAVEASTLSGRIEVFGQTTDSGPALGGAPGVATASHPVDNPVVELFLITWTGDIEVRRGEPNPKSSSGPS